ncbi:OL226 protein, partial [Fregata magnificens]|nr:OL226 protein [Fregata magnificens]
LRELQVLLAVTFITAFILTLAENMVIIIMICISYCLHTPMYFFLSNLSFLEMWYITVIVPKMLSSLLTGCKISYFAGCIAQIYFCIALACTEYLLLAVMAYDCFVGLCSPLLYSTIMTHKFCFLLVAGSWMEGFTSSVLKIFFISHLNFCDSVTNHLFCDVSPLLNLVHKDMSTAETVDFILALIIIPVPLLAMAAFHFCIAATIMCIPTAQWGWKAISTCASHLVVVVIFYSTILFTYDQPKAMGASDSNKMVSVLYTVVEPFCNPVIYCLMNQDVKEVLRKIIN